MGNDSQTAVTPARPVAQVVWMLLVLASALTLGLTFAHVLELPQRLQLPAELWASLTRPNALYRYFGVVGGPLEVVTVLGVVALAFALRHRKPTASLVTASAVLHAAALAIWISVVAPANFEIAGWVADHVPAGWEGWRLRWELGHATSFVALLAGFCFLVAGLVRSRSSV
jgi:hypothetical protein